MKTSTPTKVARSAAPLTGQRARELQAFGSVVAMPIALAEDIRRASANNLNQLLADTITLRDLYKKHHWQVSGPTFYQLHLLFDKHFGEQNELVDLIAERIMMLGGVSLAMSADVAETTLIPRPPKGREEVPVQISRLLQAHEIILKEARAMVAEAAAKKIDSPGIRFTLYQLGFLQSDDAGIAAVRRRDVHPPPGGGLPRPVAALGAGPGERGWLRGLGRRAAP